MPIFAYWDKKCLNDGQDWEQGFLAGLKSSSIIVLLISSKAVEGIRDNAAKQQDNVLIEYECSLIQNRKHKIPVVPVFLAEIIGSDPSGNATFSPCSFNINYPDLPHSRNPGAQAIVDELCKDLPADEIQFLRSIKKTMAQIPHLQGQFLRQRGENGNEINKFANLICEILHKHEIDTITSNINKNINNTITNTTISTNNTHNLNVNNKSSTSNPQTTLLCEVENISNAQEMILKDIARYTNEKAKITNTISKLTKEIENDTKLIISQLMEEIEQLTEENESLTKENESLTKGNESLTEENESVTKENESLTKDIESLTKENERLTNLITQKQ